MKFIEYVYKEIDRKSFKELFIKLRKSYTPKKGDKLLDNVKYYLLELLKDEGIVEIEFGEVYHKHGIGNNCRWLVYGIGNGMKVALGYVNRINNMFGTYLLYYTDLKENGLWLEPQRYSIR